MAAMKMDHGPKMGAVPSAVSVKTTPRRTAPINEGVSAPSAGKTNPMSTIKGKSGGKNGGAIC